MFAVHLDMITPPACCSFRPFDRFNTCDVPFAFAGSACQPMRRRRIAFHRRDGTGCQCGGYISSSFALSAL
jgi:hypothetical protein